MVNETATSRPLRALIVDDEPEVLQLNYAALRHLGYDALTASDGPDALSLLGTQPVDLLITDLVMPDMDGTDLIRLARERRPDLPILVVSGYLDSGLPQDESISFLKKPFSLSEMARAVAAARPEPLEAAGAESRAGARLTLADDRQPMARDASPEELPTGSFELWSTTREAVRALELIDRFRDTGASRLARVGLALQAVALIVALLLL